MSNFYYDVPDRTDNEDDYYALPEYDDSDEQYERYREEQAEMEQENGHL